jgi:hypothetical protein
MTKYVEIDLNVSVVVDVDAIPVDLRKVLGRGKYDTIYDHEIAEALKTMYKDDLLLAFLHCTQIRKEGEYCVVNTDTSYVYVWAKNAREIEGDAE